MTFPRTMPLLPALALGLVALSAPINVAQDAALPALTEPKIERAITAFMSNVNAPGVSVAVSHGSTVRWRMLTVLPIFEQFVPAKADTVYRLASVSRPITAVAVMQLVKRGRLSLAQQVVTRSRGVSCAMKCARAPYRWGVWQPFTDGVVDHGRAVADAPERHWHDTAAEDESGNASVKHYVSLRDALAIFSGESAPPPARPK